MTPSELEDAVSNVAAPFIVEYKRHSDTKYDFTLRGQKKPWNVRLYFPSVFPYELPTITLLDSTFIGSVPHVNIKGTVCIQEGDSQLIDYNRPTDLICYLLEQALQVFSKGDLKIYEDELTDEYEGYFHAEAAKVNSFYAAKDNVEHFYLKVIYPNEQKRERSHPVLLFDKNKSLPNSFSDIKNKYTYQVIKAIHLPFLSPALPPKEGQPITIEYINELLDDVTDKSRLNKLLLKEEKKRQHYILLSFPRSKKGERTQVLLDFNSDKSSLHPLIDRTDCWDIKIYLLKRNNQSYLLERGGADNNLSNKKVTIIGCGSVGGEVATMLAKSGVGELMLIDKDTLETDNIYRHRLGGAYIPFTPNLGSEDVPRIAKVSALKDSLERDIPYVKVNRNLNLVQTIIAEKKLHFADVVVVAVGSPSLSLWINKELKTLGHKKVIFCWNEASSLGGHSVSINLETSCFECLYTDTSGFKLNNDLSFLETGQDLTKNLTGCAGVFTPFSYLDSSQTAALATKQCLDMLILDRDSTAMSWKGENRSNLKVTQRFEESELKKEVVINSKDACHVCK